MRGICCSLVANKLGLNVCILNRNANGLTLNANGLIPKEKEQIENKNKKSD
jgi:hypothetical protein